MAEPTFLEKFKADCTQLVADYKKKMGIVSFREFKLPSGETVGYDGDTPQIGGEMYIITPQGKLPAPDAEYQMEDGTVITAKGGKMVDVKPGAPAEDKPVEQEVTPGTPANTEPKPAPTK